VAEPIQDDIETVRKALSSLDGVVWEDTAPDPSIALAALDRLVAELHAAQFNVREWKDKAQDKTQEVEELERIIQNHDGPGYVTELANVVAERDRLRIAYEQAHAVTAAVVAERDRLIQALERIAVPGSVDLADIADDEAAAAFMADALRKVKNIAREALTKITEERPENTDFPVGTVGRHDGLTDDMGG
jgi:hypothetical protein